MLSFDRSPGLSIRDQKCKLLMFLKKNSGNDLHGRPRSVAQMIRPHITFYLWSVVTMCIYRIVSGIFNVE